jgi:hypothetical protein
MANFAMLRLFLVLVGSALMAQVLEVLVLITVGFGVLIQKAISANYLTAFPLNDQRLKLTFGVILAFIYGFNNQNQDAGFLLKENKPMR